ncbi:MAG: AIPR family protein [Clostridiales bacterium]|nr:AIPR family protein [Clostridiales bacterium]
MATNTKELMHELYEEFRGLPNVNPIVRNGIENDAYPLAILKLGYSNLLGIDVTATNIEVVASYIVAPPDSGIDMFIEIEDGDEYYYHIIQVKYSDLSESQIRNCYNEMQATIKDYLKDSTLVKPTLRKVIENTNFAKAYQDNCSYFVYHKGTVKEGPTIKNKVSVATTVDLDVILQSINNPSSSKELKVPYDELYSDSYNNFIEYIPNDSQSNPVKGDKALLCSIRGYDLALLCERYYSTAQGRNILFGQNLRESLAKKSKISKEMKETIDNEPGRFWHYNNGITIIAETIDLKKDVNSGKDIIQLKNFSIINGAQTTSTLREYYIEHKYDEEALARLKNVYVLARLMEITNDRKFGNRIAVYNNSQNAISSRDMVANNPEQNALHDRFWDEKGNSPHIYIQIRNGSTKPSHPRIEKHQSTTNEELAQLAFAAFLQEPFSAKNKKATLFTKDDTRSETVLINDSYDRIFRYEIDNDGDQPIKQGILFQKNKYEIDEVLFIKYLYRAARTEKKKFLEDMIEQSNNKIADSLSDGDTDKVRQLQERLSKYQRNKEINNTCMFYCITLYYAIKEEYDRGTEGTFDYSNFYGGGSNSSYREEIIKFFSDRFLEETISIITELLGAEGNVGNWVRRAGSQKEFKSKVDDKLALGTQYGTMYQDFVDKFKTIAITE